MPRTKSNPSLKTSRQRKKMMRGVKVFHADHGISQTQMEYIVSRLRATAPQGFFIQQFTLPRGKGTVPNAMWGPAAGDAPVPESKVHYIDRAGRGWEDRMIDLPPRPVNYGQAIGIRDGDSFTLFTVYGGPLAPQNPADPGNHDVAGSQKFWKQHALSSHQWAKANPFWVSPAGDAAYLSEKSHAAYKGKHPSRGHVPRFMDHHMREKAPREELPPGFDLVPEEGIDSRGREQTRYLVFRHGEDTGKYAGSWNRAALIARRLARKG